VPPPLPSRRSAHLDGRCSQWAKYLTQLKESAGSSLQWLHQTKESADATTQSYLVLERCLSGALPDSVQMRAEPKTPHHLINLLRQPRDYAAEAHHLISAVEIDASIGFYQTSQTMNAQCAIPANPFRPEHVLTLLASAQSLPSEKRLQLIRVDTQVDAFSPASNHTYLVPGQQPLQGRTYPGDKDRIFAVAGNPQAYRTPIRIRKVSVADRNAYDIGVQFGVRMQRQGTQARGERRGWCPRSESNRHAFNGGGFSYHFGFRRAARSYSRVRGLEHAFTIALRP
jgi:hypothetical protein